MLVFLLAALWVARAALADNAFCGCFSILPSATTQVAGTYGSGTACDLACPDKKHSFYQKSTGNCYCTDKYPSEPYFQYGVADNCANPAHYDARITHTSFIWQPYCYATAPGGVTFSTLTGPDTCLKNCGTTTKAIFAVNNITNTYQCACGEPSSYGLAAPCGPGTYFAYYHTGTQASQGLARRRRLEDARKRSLPVTLCPNGLLACKIEKTSDAYECIDPSSELESCGGCMIGAVGSISPPGEDCSRLGATLGAATCLDGRCQAYRCKRGYFLADGRCHPSP